MIPHTSLRPSVKVIPSLWVQLPDIHPTKIHSIKEKLPDRFIFPLVAIAPGLNMSRSSAKTTNPSA
jgi:hypothetical protein